jgi:NAD(P)-dependent dehydrogenase (short-subunit alcohol dehydrogenase family)
MDDFPRPPFPEQQQPIPGTTEAMNPRPDHGEDSYKGSNRLNDKKVLITGGDSGIGRAVALAFAREGADLLVSYLDEHEDAAETRRLVEAADPAQSRELAPVYVMLASDEASYVSGTMIGVTGGKPIL